MGEKTVRCKFVVSEIAKTAHNGVRLEASPVYGHDADNENATFWKYTPTGKLEFTCLNEGAVAHLQPGDEIYLDITKAPAPAAV